MSESELIDHALYIFSPSEINVWKSFKHGHYVCCGSREFRYTITEYGQMKLVEIECTKCHERANLNKVY